MIIIKVFKRFIYDNADSKMFFSGLNIFHCMYIYFIFFVIFYKPPGGGFYACYMSLVLFFAYEYPAFPAAFLQETLFSTHLENHLTVLVWIYFWVSGLIQLICLSFCWYRTVFITIDLYYVLKSGCVITSVLLFSFKDNFSICELFKIILRMFSFVNKYH